MNRIRSKFDMSAQEDKTVRAYQKNIYKNKNK